MIRRLKRGRAIWKEDLTAGFKQMPRVDDQLALGALVIEGHIYIDTTACMGWTQVPRAFHKTIQSIVEALEFRFPGSYHQLEDGGQPWVRNYLDDIFGGHYTKAQAWVQHALFRMVCRWLGVELQAKKMHKAQEAADILGIEVSLANGTVSLKPEKVLEVVKMTRRIKRGASLGRKDLECLLGN